MLNLISEALEITNGSISLETNVGEVAEWDSIGWLTIISMLDERYGIQISSQEIRTIKKVKDLVDLVLTKKGS
ncbi:MAG: acyl carrier protein [Firmicutes bacterium]|nr:acyl carrier protein [Bacillota bacterium]